MKYLIILCLLQCILLVKCTKSEEKPSWAKKDLRDYTDADLERLYEQWEEDDEPLPEDELPEYKRKPPSAGIDFSKIDASDPESVLKLTKKGQTLMSFVTVSGSPTREETEEITKLWQSGLWNSHIQAERFMVDDNRAIFMFKDGSLAWDAKDYLVEQERCEVVSIENKQYYGKGAKAEVNKEVPGNSHKHTKSEL
ncbi:LDLR chaperone boca-like [Artemia franciscana]|uniref:LDLR chaperone boca n=1 Tax=Artemia franciscana TaxID=6661 RepID=A0AA88KWW7_ARTSF|nr:hypothetical protein QYM36_017313 [Artemia franciscana]KAK2705223.1 hypothetical protein QYM36_017313 [Artemia franciscana]KAK2705224.1 hypothetical protein QYM36_017313 [Artemia franciscana]KAK2705225.1 hypothetical protein QYM36_017313 [Artemia franciscana]KAK2705226.1 hypothetical protein QYM36_017313 [Artemia franciscana]